MRKFFLAVAALAMLATSCTKDETTVAGGESLVSFSVSSPELQTRAYGDGTEAKVLYYAFYDEEETLLNAISVIGEENAEIQSVELVGGKATINVPLVDGRIYSAIFWAQNANAPYTVDWTDKEISYKENVNLTANNEAYDAFYNYTINIDPARKTHKIELRRPFAQLNIATKDLAAAKAAGVEVKATKVKVDAYKTLTFDTEVDATTGEVVPVAKVSNKETFTYNWAPVIEDVKVMTDYDLISMNYVLVNARELVNVTLRMSEVEGQNADNDATDLVRTYSTVPVQRNYRTYIVGNLLTTNNEFNIETKPEWEKDPNNDKVYYAWDGSEVKMPKVNAEDNNIYEIEDASELAWLAAAVNGTLTEDYTRSTVAVNNFAGKTFKLVKDINLGGKEWTPIGMGKNLSAGETFRGTFDGQGHTIYGLNVNQKEVAGLFGYVYAATIQNVIIDGATINSNHYAGGIVAWINNNTGNIQVPMVIDNCHVKNSTITSTPEKINGEWDNGDKVGGIVGYADFGTAQYAPNQGAEISDCSVEKTTIKAYRDFAGIAGYASYTTINRCNVADDVTFVWDNSQNYKNYADENAANKGNIIGRYEGLNTVDGKLYVASAAQLQAALDAATGETKIYLGANIVGDVTAVQKQGVKVTIDGDGENDGEGKKYNGVIKVHSNSNHYADAALTIKNVDFETSTASVNFIEALENGAERYSQNITAENCTFTATGEAVNTAVGVQIKASKNAKVIGCTATNMHSLIQAQSCDESVLVQNCKVVNGKNGVAFKQVKSAIVEDTTITATGYGIRFDGNIDNYGIVVKNNTVTAAQPLIVRKMTGANNTITLEGTNTLTTEAEYQIVITNGEDDAEYVKPTGTYTLTGADNFKVFPAMPKAKVGNTEYTNMDEAIAAWTNNTTLTLLANVTLTEVIKIKSTEARTLELGTYTMTAASGNHAIEITCEGRSSASYALTINADATNPGGISAKGNACIYYKKSGSTKDRPIIRIYNGVFNGSYSINSISNGNTNCPQVWIYGGVFNGNVNLTKNMLRVWGGTFHGWINCTGDSSAYREISGGRFKSWQFMTADAPSKFWVGTAKETYDVGCYVDDEGYLVVGGPVITEFGDKFAAKATNATKWSSYLKYSSAAANGLYYTNAEMAITKHGAANVELKQ